MSPDPDRPAGDDWKPMNCPAGCYTVVGRNPQVAASIPILTGGNKALHMISLALCGAV